MEVQEILQLKGKRKITMLTAYDFPTAKILSQAGIDMLLVGDSLGMVVLGYPDTRSVTMDDMIRHTQAVCRGNIGGSMVIFDMPFGTCDTVDAAVRNAERAYDETGVRVMKVEGRAAVVRGLVEAGFPVVGHTGLKPQDAQRYGVVGRDEQEAARVLEEALALEAAGAFCVVLECVPASLGTEITAALRVPTVGIGAGAGCDGQVLVVSDMIGLYREFSPKFLRRYADVAGVVDEAVRAFREDVESGQFPAEGEGY